MVIALALSGRRVSNVSFCFLQQAGMSIAWCKRQAATEFGCQKLTAIWMHSAYKGCWRFCPQIMIHVIIIHETEALWHVHGKGETTGHIVMVAHLMHMGSLVWSKSFCDYVQQEMLLYLQLFTHVDFITQFLPSLKVCLMQAVATSIGNCLQKNLDTYTTRFACFLCDALW